MDTKSDDSRIYAVTMKGVLVNTILMAFNLNDERETLLPLVDKYLNAIFASFELLTKTIYKNLVENETLQKDDIMQIIKDWEDFKHF